MTAWARVISDHQTCVLATVNGSGQPHTSLMCYSVLRMSETAPFEVSLVMMTSSDSKKWRNIEESPTGSVSVLIDSRQSEREPILALTITGAVILPQSGDEELRWIDVLKKKFPDLETLDSRTKAFAVKASSLQLLTGIKDSTTVVCS